ncbi:MAG: hypothetical protein KJZ84_07845 [Bryobacteraceae bacterium]|nr:hypothetical protein [Bryobacteraceae bacterium]
MNLRQIPFLTGILLIALAGTALANNIFVLPPPGATANTIQGYTPQMLQLGSVTPPAGTTQILSTPQGDKAIFIANNPLGPVSFISVVSGQITGTVRTLTLDGRPATRALVSPDGTRLYVIAGSQPGNLYTVDLITETVLLTGTAVIGGTPRDFGISPDGSYAYIISGGVATSGLLTIVNLQNAAVEAQFGNIGVLNNVTVSPTGRVFITGQFQLLEYSGKPPFTRVGFSQLISSPGRLYFSPTGRHMLAGNNLLNGRSIQLFDLNIPGQNNTNPPEPASAAVIAEAAIALPTAPSELLFPDQIFITSATKALVHLEAAGRIMEITYQPSLTVAEAAFPGIGTLSGLSSVAVSNEFPAPRSIYYLQGQLLSRYDLSMNNTGGSVNIGPQGGGPVRFAGSASAGPVSDMFLYGAAQTVQPGARLKPYAVRVVDALGKPVLNAPVIFSSTIAGVTLSATNVTTNIDGIAITTATAPPTNGEFTVRATSGPIVREIVSTVIGGTGTGPGDPGTSGPRLIKVSGDGQLTQIFNGFTQPMTIKVVDGDDKPIPGVNITWTFSEGVSSASETNMVTDNEGKAQFRWIPGGSIPGGQSTVSYTIAANTEIGTATFIATAFPFTTGGFDTSPTVALLSPPQENRALTVQLGTPKDNAVRVEVVTSGGAGLSGGIGIPNVGVRVYTVNVDPERGPFAQCEGITALTDDKGVANCKVVASGRTGIADMIVDVGGEYRLFSGIRLTVTPGAPAKPVITQGDKQSGKTGELLPLALAARISDSFGNVLPGTPVTWEIVTANTLTLQNTVAVADQNGLVSTRVRLGSVPGTHQIRLRAGDQEVLFDVIVESQVGGFAIVSGNNQTGVVIGQPFPLPLTVRVTNLTGQPVTGQVVAWAVTAGSAQVSAATSTSDNDGRAIINVVAGTSPGSITVTATVTGQPALTFTLASRLPGPVLNALSFRNAASNETGITPGGLIRINGIGLAPGITGERNASLLGGRLPLEFAGVRVEFTSAGVSAFAPIYQVANMAGSESLLLQVPFDLPGPLASATVTVQGGSTTVQNIQVLPASPGVLEDNFPGGRRAAVVIRSDGLVVTPETPARRGETLRMYAIGLGQTTPTADTNRVGQPDQVVRAAVAVGIDDAGVEVVSAKLAENLIGVYEIIFVVPQTATFGNDRPLGFVMEVNPGQPLYANGSIIAIGPQ